MTKTASPQTCPLCRTDEPPLLAEVRGRPYYQCGNCHLIFLHPRLRPTPDAEKAQYATHENDPADLRYRNFLNRLAESLLPKLPPAAEGLDYGAGPGPTLSVMLEERGFPMRIHDPFFAPHREALDRTYDFITCTETAEHFFESGREFNRLNRLLRPAGWLGLMTLPPIRTRTLPTGITCATRPTSASTAMQPWHGLPGTSAGSWRSSATASRCFTSPLTEYRNCPE